MVDVKYFRLDYNSDLLVSIDHGGGWWYQLVTVTTGISQTWNLRGNVGHGDVTDQVSGHDPLIAVQYVVHHPGHPFTEKKEDRIVH